MFTAAAFCSPHLSNSVGVQCHGIRGQRHTTQHKQQPPPRQGVTLHQDGGQLIHC